MPEREDQKTREDDPDLDGLDDMGLDDQVGSLDDDLGAGGMDDVGLDQDPSEQYGDLVDGSGDGLAGSDAEEATATEARQSDDGGFLSGLFGGDESAVEETDEGGRLDGFFSGRAFLAMLVGATALAGVGNLFVPFVGGLVGAPAGLFLGTFLAGLIGDERRYVEAGVVGLVLGVLAAVGDVIPTSILVGAGLGVAVATGAAVGLVVAVLGLYFGRDLRAGLSKDIGGGE